MPQDVSSWCCMAVASDVEVLKTGGFLQCGGVQMGSAVLPSPPLIAIAMPGC